MKIAKYSLFLCIILILQSTFLSGEIALDQVVQAGRFVFYRDHADPHIYYYVPDAPRLATKADGTPEFTFIKYTKIDGETKGGILHFLVTWGLTAAEISAAQALLRQQDPQAKIAGPVPFKEGVFRVISSTAGEGGLFNRRIVGEGKAPILPGQKAAVSIALTPEGASLLWESFKNPTSDVSVMYTLKFAGLTPAFQAKLKVNWDKVYTHHDVRLQAEGTIKIVRLEADIKAILDDLRQKGAIQLEVAGEDVNMQKLLDSVYNHLISMMCDITPILPEEVQGKPTGIKKALTSSSFLFNSLAPKPDNMIKNFNSPILSGGGPFYPELEADKLVIEPQEKSFCNEQNQKRALELRFRAENMIQEKKYEESIDLNKRAYKICPNPIILYKIAETYEKYLFDSKKSLTYYLEFLKISMEENLYPDLREDAVSKINNFSEFRTYYKEAEKEAEKGNPEKVLANLLKAHQIWPSLGTYWNIGVCYYNMAFQSKEKQKEYLENALKYFQEYVAKTADLRKYKDKYNEAKTIIEDIKEAISLLPDIDVAIKKLQEDKAAGIGSRKIIIRTIEDITLDDQQEEQLKKEIEASKQVGTKTRQVEEKETSKKTKEDKVTSEEKKPGTTGLTERLEETKTMETKPKIEPKATEAKPSPELKQKEGDLPKKEIAEEKRPEAKPSVEIKPIINVQLGYTFKRVKLSGNYEVDLRKRLREDVNMVMSGNISGVFQRYGEDRRFFTIVSLDDPTYQERTIDVILDGQDASDFKEYINSVSVIFKKQRFSGPPVTGEVKFFYEQFSQTGNRLTFKYGRLNEASTEWLDYEYKTKWSFYGGIEWEGDWVRTSDSVLALSPPVRRRTIQISVDEENIIKNNIRAVAIQIKHRIFGHEVFKEIIIDYYRGDPLQAEYIYLHEERNLSYGYKIIWLFNDGREVESNWITKESPFIYGIYSGN
jgi:tetratricopeptide (TPR) repeat protein